MEPIKWISRGVGSVSNASVLDNFHENLPFGLSFADLSQAQQTLDSAVLHNSQLSNQALQHAHHHHMQDPSAAGAGAGYPTMSTSYAQFPILQAATMHSPQLHQPTVNVTKDSSSNISVATTSSPVLVASPVTSTEGVGGPGTSDAVATAAKPKVKAQPPRNRSSGVAATASADAMNGSEGDPNAAAADHSFVPVRVTRPPNAFLLFNKEMRRQLKDSNPTMKVAEISKEIGDRWKHLSATEKERYVNEANSIRETQRALHPNSMYVRRSKAELVKAGHYAKLKRKVVLQQQSLSSSEDERLGSLDPFKSSTPPGTAAEGGPRKRQRRDKNPAAPKHPLSAYMWYLTEVRPETMQAYPGSTVGQISKLCAERWNTMTETERMPWHTKAQADKARYACEMQIYASHHDHPMGRGTRQKYRAAAAAAAAAASAISASSNSTSSIASSPSPTSATAANATAATAQHLSPDHSNLLTSDHHHHFPQLDPTRPIYYNQHQHQHHQQQTSNTPTTAIPDQFHHHKHYHHPHHHNDPTSSLLHSVTDQDPADLAAMFPTSRMT